MLAQTKIMGFIPTTDFEKARAFYEGVLGLRVTGADGFALVFDANGITVRVTKIPKFQPQQFTIFGWEVPDIVTAVRDLAGRGVQMEKYGIPGQDERGIWTAPSGAKVAWFKDPDGNILSLTRFPE